MGDAVEWDWAAVSAAAEAPRCTLFPRVDADEVAACVRRRPSRPLTSSVAALAALAERLESAWAGPVHVGFNPASGSLSVSVPLVASPRSSSASSADTYEPQVLRAVVEGLLGVSHHAERLEASWAKWKAAAVDDTIGGRSTPDAWANVALSALERSTGYCVSDRTVHVHTGAVVLSLAPPSTEGPRASPFRFCPSYFRMRMQQHEMSGESSPSTGEETTGDVVQGIVHDAFWEAVERAHYLAGDELRVRVSALLRAWVASSVAALGQRRGFRPRPGVKRVYLWGTPGVGKSEFVKVMVPALEVALRGCFDPSIKVEAVKVQLNALTMAEFRGASRVRGISDMSIERICEQSLQKGNVVVLHFEENPEEEGTQDDLFECGEELLRALFGTGHNSMGKAKNGTPEASGLVWVVTTSNYPPSKLVQGKLDGIDGSALVRMGREVDDKATRAWAIRKLTAAVTGAMPERDVSVIVFPAFPCQHAESSDLRSLGSWWNTLAFHAVRVSMDVSELCLSKGRASAPLTVYFESDDYGKCSVRAVERGDAEIGAEAIVRVHAEDGIFWSAPPPLEAGTNLPERVVQVVWMHRLNWLRPAVIAVRGSHDRQRSVASAIEDVVRSWSGPQYVVKRIELELRTDADKVRLFGSKSSVQGGLFAWIAGEVNGGHMTEESILGVIVLRVSHEGQFAAREVLEASESRTHRLAVRKDRLLFLVLPLGNEGEGESAADERVLQPQLLSRCHAVA